MTKLTKADIDGLVAKAPRHDLDPGAIFFGELNQTGAWLTANEIQRVLYRWAGLNAAGSPKPEKADVWCRDEPRRWLATGTWDGTTFTPDGAE